MTRAASLRTSAAAALLLTAVAANGAPAATVSKTSEMASLPAVMAVSAAGTPASGSARVAQLGPSPPSRAISNQPAGIVAANMTLTLDRGKGVLLRLPRAAASIFVADPDTVDFQTKSGALVYVFGKAAGETVLYAVDGGGNMLYSARVRVTPNLSGVRDALARYLPDDAIAVEGAGGSITLSGTVLSAAHAADALAIATQFVDAKKGENIVNLLAVAAPAQVNLRVRIAEVDRNVLKQFGINWDAVVNSGRFAFGLMTQNPIEIAGVFNRNTLSIKRNNVGAMIDALAQEGLITLLAQPNLTALSGETASFLAGGEFPVPVASTPGSGLPTITIVFKKFGVSLDFTPTIIDANRINLRVRPEVSQLTTTGGVQVQGFSVPGLTVRRAETTVELGSGETFVIAGLLQFTSENTLSKVPGAGDIPVIGALLRSSRYQRRETELAIIVTPYLVKPIAGGAAVAAPTDGFDDANDLDRVLGGKFYRTPPVGPSAAKKER